jgi:hypothetical protein
MHRWTTPRCPRSLVGGTKPRIGQANGPPRGGEMEADVANLGETSESNERNGAVTEAL